MILDCHVHINNYADETKDLTEKTFDELQKSMRRNRIDAAMILTSYKVNPGRPSTEQVVRLTENLKHLYVVAGISYLGFNINYLFELRDHLKDGTVRGLKLYPGYEPFYPYDETLYPVYELAEEFDVPVMIHTGDTYSPTGRIKYSHPIHVDEVAVDFPAVKFVICHLGNPWTRDAMEVVYKNDNVYTDISGLVLGNFTDRFEVFMRKQLQEMIMFGVDPNSVLFGTDWPICTMETYLKFVNELKLPIEEKKKILWENGAKLFKLSTTDSQLNKGSMWDFLKT